MGAKRRKPGLVRKAAVGAIGCCLTALVFAQESAESCVGCHRDRLSLAGRDRDELAAQIREIRDGSADHVVPIPALSDEETVALADALVRR